MARRLALTSLPMIAAVVVACSTTRVQVPDQPTAVATEAPTDTTPQRLATFPTAQEPAPEQTFTLVGNVGHLEGDHDVSGKAIVAGLQTLIIQGFTFDGKGPQADLRLVKEQDYARPAAVLIALEQRPYEDEFFLLRIPNSVTRDNADRLVVYAPETGEVYAETTFQ